MLPTPVIAVALAPLVLWRVYARIRRLTVRQQSQPWRHRISLCVFPPFILWMLVAASDSPFALVGLLGGMMAGSLLGVAALNKTVFERVGDDFFYTPFAPIGIVISVLFLIRLAWRGVAFLSGTDALHGHVGHSPLTLLVFGLLAGYYMAYSFGLLRWRKHAAAE